MRTLAPGEIGELVVQCPQQLHGYWRKADDTAQVLRDGWIYTGDIARMDDDGFFYIVDRKKEMILSGGFNVYPQMIEQAIYTHPAVHEVLVIGVPDERWGEAVHAVVQPRVGRTVDLAAIEALVRAGVAASAIDLADHDVG